MGLALVIELGRVADLTAEDPERKPRVFFHYTTAPLTSFARGFRSQSSFTDDGSYSSKEAQEKLGIPLPNKVITVTDPDKIIVPQKPPFVPAHKWGAGGGADFYNRRVLPPTNTIYSKPVN